MSEERWVAVIGFEGLYEVSDRGRVRSVDRLVLTSNGWHFVKSHMHAGCVNSNGYRHVTLCREGVKTYKSVHQLVVAAFCGGYGEHTRHLDGNKLNNHWTNLAAGTPKENGEDRVRHGTTWKGDARSSVLSSAAVVDIKNRRAGGSTFAEIAMHYGVCESYIARIVRGVKWRHLFDDSHKSLQVPKARRRPRVMIPEGGVAAIVSDRKCGLSWAAISRKHGVSQTTARCAVKRMAA